jgi:hypothetical protein
MITIERITEMQESYGLTHAQDMVNNGSIWGFEGSVGRAANNMLESGALMLPQQRNTDYWGNTVPSRDDLVDGTKGTLGRSQMFWQLVEDGDENCMIFAEEYTNFMKF